jgi:DNA processing protein
MTAPRACPDCLRRSWLLAELGPYIERSILGGPGHRALALFRLGSEDLAAAVAPKVAAQILARNRALGDLRLAEQLEAAGCWACCRHEELYPGGLRAAEDAPWALIGRGDPARLADLGPQRTVAIVGSRRAGSYGREVARDLGRELGAAGITILSGLAFGIDACAHRGTLDAGGLTVAVLGCDPDVAYPAAHRSLWRQVSEQGLVLSELPPGAVPWRWSFPARNRIVAALAGITVVVEAAARSGSLLTAEAAARLSRPLGAVPGPVTSSVSAGPNALLAQGASVIRGSEDVLAALALGR